MKQYIEQILLVMAILVGSLTGFFFSFDTVLIDFFVIAMLFFLFYNTSFDKLLLGAKNKRYLSVAWIANFVIVPTLAFVIASIFVDTSSAVFVGLIFYLVAPCTDWFLGFTRLAGGDVEVNSVLLPINLLSQLVLLPVYLYLFTAIEISVPFSAFLDVLLYWALFPFVIAQLVRFMVRKSSARFFVKSSSFAGSGMLLSLVLLVFSICNAHIGSLLTNISLLPSIFAVIFLFFVVTYFLMKFISRRVSFSKKERVSLTITTVARNAPLMLALVLGLFPQETLIPLVLIIGMLIEIPFLIIITYVLKK